jgi:outer membrane protein OmpA-like peptidoglycan-associated protein
MTTHLKTLACSALFTIACSSATPNSLVDARAAYQRASRGPAARLTPAQLHVAHTSLGLAETVYKEEGDSANARDRAYVAQRKAELAETQASIASADQRAAEANRRAESNEDRATRETRRDLTIAQSQLANEHGRRQDAERRTTEAISQRQDAERRTSEAIAQLGKVASVKEEPRGTVITLSGAVIFASGKSELLPAARTRLDQVATALNESDRGSKFLVEGHTDSRGSAEQNQELSLKRAQSVQAYLVARQVPSDRISSVGRGLSNPIADNETAEGRANNRRVEIVVQGP